VAAQQSGVRIGRREIHDRDAGVGRRHLREADEQLGRGGAVDPALDVIGAAEQPLLVRRAGFAGDG
jgi:hypothetical protein